MTNGFRLCRVCSLSQGHPPSARSRYMIWTSTSKRSRLGSHIRPPQISAISLSPRPDYTSRHAPSKANLPRTGEDDKSFDKTGVIGQGTLSPLSQGAYMDSFYISLAFGGAAACANVVGGLLVTIKRDGTRRCSSPSWRSGPASCWGPRFWA